MRKIKKISNKLLLAVLLLLLLLPTAAFAQGAIETERDCSVTLHYVDDKMPIVGARFSFYRVANTTFNGELSLTGEFADAEKYPISLDCEDSESWFALASTLNGFVKKNAAVPEKTCAIGNDGSVKVEGLKPGMYLVLGDIINYADYDYSATPFLIFLPNAVSETNSWDYDVDANVKFDKVYNPPYVPGSNPLTVTVLKDWNDKGKEDARPKEITVELYCDGKLYAKSGVENPVVLNERNGLSCSWQNLEREHDWTVAEVPVPGYTTTVVSTKSGSNKITFTIKNTPTEPEPEEPHTSGVIPVIKRISGEFPTVKSDFTFVLMAKKSGNPMPAGSLDNVKELTISGAGTGEFGPLYFTKAGVYEYALSEKYGGVSGYTYDTSVYTVRFTVTETADDGFDCVRSIIKSDGSTVASAEFNNPYKVPPSGPPILPQTGLLWWPVPVLLCAGLLFLLIGVSRRRRHG